MASNPILIAGGLLSAGGGLLHLAAIVGGASWYRALGAGERLARLVEQGSWMPHLLTLGIVAVLAVWSAYAFSGAGLIPRLPLIRTALVLISGVYLLRGLVLIPAFALNPGGVTPFTLWSSLIVLVFGVAYAVGTWIAWPALSGGR